MIWGLGLAGVLGLVVLVGLGRELYTKACLNPKAKSFGGHFDLGEPEELRVLILGDQGSGDKKQQQVAAAMEQVAEREGCDLVLLLGDNFIQKGIKDLEDPQLQNKFEAVYSLNKPFYAVLGNHDFKGNWRAQIAYSEKSTRWRMPAATYRLEVGPVCFDALNTTCSLCSFFSLRKKTLRPWHIAFAHHPLVSTGRHGHMLKSEQRFVVRSGIDAYLSGHHHLLEHIEYEGIDQITSGGGGTNLNEKAERPHPGKRFYLLDHGFVWAKYTAHTAEYRFYDKEAQEVYSFTREKASEPAGGFGE
ncbi:MAG: metallophosphoesterase [bacterium]|nr:metallophosphoesterase [bacterium]